MYLIGDVQGCDEPLARLLAEVEFSASRDRLVVLGDLVNRGPASAATLRRLMALDDAAQALLGNHDLHLLAAAAGARKPSRKDTLANVLQAPDRERLLGWLRRRPMALWEDGCLMVHAGVLPQWTAPRTLELAREVEAVLRGPGLGAFLHAMYGNHPRRWHDGLEGMDRIRMIVNALTRLRFCTADGTMDFDAKDGADAAPPGFMPWFEVPGRATASDTVAFGHWSTLGWLGRDRLLALDSGCVWGGCLTALRWHADPAQRERITVNCPQAQEPG